MIPPPRQNQVRYHGVFAANHAWRAQIVPKPRTAAARVAAASGQPRDPDNGPAVTTDGRQPGRLDWAALLRRVFGPDVTDCPVCPGRLRVIAFVTDPDLVLHILSHLGLPTCAPAVAPPRGPPQLDLADSSPDPW